MKKIIFITALVLLVLIWIWKCDDKIIRGDRNANETEQATIEKTFALHKEDGLVSYDYKYYMADLNNDGTDEMLKCYGEGSGFVSFCVDCYEQTTDTFSQINERTLTDYTLYLYEDNLYIISSQSPVSSFFDTSHDIDLF